MIDKRCIKQLYQGRKFVILSIRDVYFTISGCSLAIGLGLLAIRFFGPLGFMDVPGGRRQHKYPVPRVGGIALLLGIGLGAITGLAPLHLSIADWVAILTIAAMGIADDRFELRARWKAIVCLAIAILLAWSGLQGVAQHVHHYEIFGWVIPNRPEILFTLLLLMHWGIPQAFNLIDGANGLAIGFSLLLSLALAMLGQINYVLPGILLGLLALNWPKARLFLGDCGSLTLGLLFTILARQALPTIRPNGLLCLFAYPILDVTLVVLIRLSKGVSPMTADRNHMHHHLLKILGKLAFLRVPILWVLAGSSMAITLANGIWNFIPWAGFTALLLLFVGIFLFRRSFDTEDPHSVTSNLDGILH